MVYLYIIYAIGRMERNMKIIEEKEFNQILENRNVVLSEIHAKEFLMANKEIDILEVYNCQFEKVEIVNCKIQKISIINSKFINCNFIDIAMYGENIKLQIKESDYQRCLIKNFEMDSFQEKSEISGVKFYDVEFNKIHLYADIIIKESIFENCKTFWLEFKGSTIEFCSFNKISGGDCSFQSKFIKNKLNYMDLDEYHIKIDMLEV